MQLRVDRVEVRGARPHDLEVDWTASGELVTWSVANRADDPVAVDAVALVCRLEAVVEPLRVLRHGYQSWSPTAVATFRVDDDPSRAPGARSLVLGMHHADAGIAEAGELRSELVTAMRDGVGSVVVIGFLGGSEHDGTIRVRAARDGSNEIEVWIEAYLGGAVLESSERRDLHDVSLSRGEGDASPLLEAWAAEFGSAASARTSAPYQVGWCSWYHYFHSVSEADLRGNLAEASKWPFDVFQLDDGFQSAIGDWLTTNDRFPTPIDGIAAAIAAEGRTPGVWLAPFLAGPFSRVYAEHPEWTATHAPSGRPLVGMVNDGWGGAVYTLDTTNPEVLQRIEDVSRALVDAGFPYLKLDFTYAPSLPGHYLDPSRTPAQRVRAGFEAVRRGAGEAAFLLGCGAPLGSTAGVVDGMRIGADVGPWWHVPEGAYRPPGHAGGEPATVNAWRNTLSRSFLHRRLWLNDPDCLMLRTDKTQLDAEQVRAWALAVGVSGGMALVSDDLSMLGADARALLDEVVALGREADAESILASGHPPRCRDLLDSDPPARLATSTVELVGDPDAGSAHVQGLLA
ncbi:MAG: glycoside hydrolase family 36 protein [Acidimicrobiales bacterium]